MSYNETPMKGLIMSEKTTTEATVTDEPIVGEKTVTTYLTKLKASKRIRAAAIVTVIVGVTILASKKLAVPADVEADSEDV